MDYVLYEAESNKVSRELVFLKDSLLQKEVTDFFEKYNVNETDAARVSVCLSILSAKETARRLGGRTR
jgi:hypothetical protein